MSEADFAAAWQAGWVAPLEEITADALAWSAT
jgi:hypothetical protein